MMGNLKSSLQPGPPKRCKLDDGPTKQPVDDVPTKADTKTLKRLLEIRGSINSCDSQGTSPLHLAAETGNISFLKYLLDKKAVVNCKDVCHLTPLHLAAGNGHAGCVKALIHSKAYLDEKDIWGWTPLHRSVINRHFRTAELLIASGCSVNVSDETKRVPLHVAASYGNQALAERLLQAGASIDWVDNRGRTPLYLAVVGNHSHLVGDLISHGCQLDICTTGNISALTLAALKGYSGCVLALLLAGAQCKNRHGSKRDTVPVESALLRAQNTEGKKFKEYVEIIRLLIQADGEPPSSQCFFLTYRILQLDLCEEALWIMQLLFAAGMRPQLPVLTMQTKVDPIISQWLSKYLGGSQSLQDLCRLRIRKELHRCRGNILYAGSQLQVPNKLRDIITLERV